MFVIDGQTNPQNILDFFCQKRGIELNPSPPTLSVSQQAVGLIKDFIGRSGSILIYGDYDVDGICATTLLWQAIYPINKNVRPFIPERKKDGYGFKYDSYQRHCLENNFFPELVITADNGVTAKKEINKLRKDGVKVVVIDHHLAEEELPKVDGLIYNAGLCAGGLAYFTAKELGGESDLGLAALATVADCQPLTGINRAIVKHGLDKLRLAPNVGVKKLLELSAIKVGDLTTYHLGFVLGPRINAIGRLTSAADALRLLCSQTEEQAKKYAQVLDRANQDRQSLQKESLDVAEKQVDLANKLIWVEDESFNQGIIGLIAGRLCEKYYLPAIAISVDGETAKGSCRSIPELNIIDTLRQFGNLFIDLGGHVQAAGFTIATANIPRLGRKLVKLVNQQLKDLVKPAAAVDAQMLPSGATLANYEVIKEFEPFGIGNPEPLFLFKGLEIKSIRVLGQTGDHLKLKFEAGLDAIGFKQGNLATKLRAGEPVSFIASLSANTWNSVTTPQLVIREIF